MCEKRIEHNGVTLNEHISSTTNFIGNQFVFYASRAKAAAAAAVVEEEEEWRKSLHT